MATRVEAITKRPTVSNEAWRALSAHYRKVKGLHLRQLFADDPQRGTRMTAEAPGLLLDYSKNRITAETLNLLLKIAEESRLRERIDAMFRGEKINITVKGEVFHTPLRAPLHASLVLAPINVAPNEYDTIYHLTVF